MWHLRLLSLAFAAASILFLSTARAEGQEATTTEPTQPVVVETSSLRTAGWITVGGGVAFLSGSAALFLLADHQVSDARSTPNSFHQPDLIENYRTGGQVLLFAGLAGVGTGLSLVLFAPKQSNAPHVSVGLGGIAVSGAF